MARPQNKKLEYITIRVSKKTYEQLKEHGKMGDTIEQVIINLIKSKK